MRFLLGCRQIGLLVHLNITQPEIKQIKLKIKWRKLLENKIRAKGYSAVYHNQKVIHIFPSSPSPGNIISMWCQQPCSLWYWEEYNLSVQTKNYIRDGNFTCNTLHEHGNLDPCQPRVSELLWIPMWLSGLDRKPYSENQNLYNLLHFETASTLLYLPNSNFRVDINWSFTVLEKMSWKGMWTILDEAGQWWKWLEGN